MSGEGRRQESMKKFNKKQNQKTFFPHSSCPLETAETNKTGTFSACRNSCLTTIRFRRSLLAVIDGTWATDQGRVSKEEVGGEFS